MPIKKGEGIFIKKYINPFLYNVPEIDIHGHNRFSAEVEIKNSIEYFAKTGIKKFLIIHGKGSGILKKVTHEYLTKNNKVDCFMINNLNDGETIVILKEGLWK